MTNHGALRFTVVCGRPQTGAAWVATVRRVEALGYDAVLTPDTEFTPSPMLALASAATVSERLRLGPWVLAAPFRTPGAVVRDAAALQLLSDGRLELGLGTGRPGAEGAAHRLGVRWGTGAERLAQVLEVVDAVRAEVEPVPPITIAASGPRALEAAGRVADLVALALPPTATTDQVRAAAELARAAGDPEFALQLAGVGGEWVAHLARSAPPQEVAVHSAGFLRGDADAMANQLTALAEATGVRVFPVAEEHAEAFAPVMARLR